MTNDGNIGTAKPRIVMIDDEVSNLQIVKIVTMREDFESDLVLFDNGQKALEYLQDNPADLILLDLAMPVMNGFEIISRLKENPTTAEIPVIFLSAYQDTSYILKAFEMGATDFLAKPIISPILTARIRQILKTRTLEKDLRRSNEELVNTNQLKDELISICSHDLRSPLSAIELVCQFLEETIDGRSEESQGKLVNRIVSQTRLARRLVENLLDLNRIAEGRLTPTSSFFVVDELLKKCGEEEEPNLQSRGLKFDRSSAEEGLLCFGDPDMIAQVVRNLLNNAAKYASSSVSYQAELVSYSEDNGGRLEIRVADDGGGIPTEMQGQIFDKYTKLERQGSGSGLGLYISRQMMELHRGTLSVRSIAGEDTVFTLSLPNAFKPRDLPHLSDYTDAKVVLAAASKSNGEMLERLLLEGGLVDIVQAADPAQLEQAMGSGTPDLVVVDLEATELLSHLSQESNGKNSATHWLLYGTPERAEMLKGVLSGQMLILEAPFNPLQFLRQVVEILHTQGTPNSSASV